MKRISIFTTSTFTTLIVTIGAGLLAWFFLIKPELHRLNSTVSQRNQLQTEIAEIAEKQRLLPEARQQSDLIRQDLARLATALPQESEVGTFVSTLERLSGETGTQVDSINIQSAKAGAKAGTPTSQYAGTTVDMKLVGTYDSVKALISRLYNLDRLVTIRTVSFASQADSDLLTGTLNITIYSRDNKTK